MQPVSTAFQIVRAGVSDALAVVLPANTVALGVHIFNELFAGTAAVHGVINGVHQLEFPAFALCRRAVFPAGHTLLRRLFVGFQHRQTVPHTDFIAGLTQPLERFPVLPELEPAVKPERVDDQMIVQMPGVDVGRHEDFMPRPLLRQLQTDGMRLRRRELFLRRKGLDVLIKKAPGGLPERFFGQHKFFVGRARRAIYAGQQADAAVEQRLVLAAAIVDHPLHRVGGLLDIFYESHGSHVKNHLSVLRISS